MLTDFRSPSRDEVEVLMREARRIRAEAFQAAFKRLGRSLAAYFTAFGETMRQRNLTVDLYRLSDAHLKDIGISRDQIPGVVMGVIERPQAPRLRLVETEQPVQETKVAVLRRAA